MLLLSRWQRCGRHHARPQSVPCCQRLAWRFPPDPDHLGCPQLLQGGDVGTQYRSGIYTHDEEQAAAAAAHIKQLNEKLGVRGRLLRL